MPYNALNFYAISIYNIYENFKSDDGAVQYSGRKLFCKSHRLISVKGMYLQVFSTVFCEISLNSYFNKQP